MIHPCFPYNGKFLYDALSTMNSRQLFSQPKQIYAIIFINCNFNIDFLSSILAERFQDQVIHLDEY